jgi:hypothetical protein
MIHTPAQEARRNLLHALLVRTVLDVCPLTVRACALGGLRPLALFGRAIEGRRFSFLDRREPDLVWNEIARALGEVITEADIPMALDLLEWEAPFWKTRVVSPPLDAVEHVVHTKRFDHDQVLAWVRGESAEAPERALGQHVVAARAGRDVAVWVTPDPEAVLANLRAEVLRARGAPS